MTLRILSLTFNDLTSWNRIEPRIITSKSETDPNETECSSLVLHIIRNMICFLCVCDDLAYS